MDNEDNIDKVDKVKVQLERDVANELIKRKTVGDTYSDIIRRLLKDDDGKQTEKKI